MLIGRRDQQFIQQRYPQGPQRVADLTQRAQLLLAPAGREGGIVADQYLRKIWAFRCDMLQPVLAPLQFEPVPAAPFHRHGQDHTVGLGRLDDRLPVPLVDQDPGPATGQLIAHLRQPGVDKPLRGLNRGALALVRPVAGDTEEGLAERCSMIHRHDQQGVLG